MKNTENYAGRVHLSHSNVGFITPTINDWLDSTLSRLIS